MDFGTLYTALLVLAGLIWLSDRWLLRPRRLARAAPGASLAEPLLVQYARSFFPIILLVLVVRSFLFEPFRIPSESMMPGLVDGDFVFVSKFSYGLRLPVTNTKILATGEPQRGEVVVFRLPREPSTHFIKRLIGLPGDRVTVRNNQVTVNGEALTQRPGGQYPGRGEFNGSPLVWEKLNDKEHIVMFAENRPARDFDAVVPSGHYFFMGDNRNDSEDGRFALVGFVPEANLVGHALRIGLNWNLPDWPDWRRIGKKIE
jgi:signal peptidase I